MGAFGRGWEGAGRHRIELRHRQFNPGFSGFGKHPLGVVKPAGSTGGNQMVQPGDLGFALRHADRMGGAIGQQLGTGWRAELVIDNRHLATLFANTQHGLGKVGTTGGVDPAGAKNQVTSAESDGLFPRQLGCAIDIERDGRIGF
ncbi:hypothetical protein D3C79_614210 [compost metagenome]